MSVLAEFVRPLDEVVVEEALEAVALTQVRDKQTKTFSGGMKRRLGIAQAILSGAGAAGLVEGPSAEA